jgi:hypothetical protein
VRSEKCSRAESALLFSVVGVISLHTPHSSLLEKTPPSSKKNSTLLETPPLSPKLITLKNHLTP